MDANAVVIKRYARSRLYEPPKGCCVTLKQLRAWPCEGRAIIVVDVETGVDVAWVLLAQKMILKVADFSAQMTRRTKTWSAASIQAQASLL
jgi:polyhydroxyalkanoate synthesis regulator protein